MRTYVAPVYSAYDIVLIEQHDLSWVRGTLLHSFDNRFSHASLLSQGEWSPKVHAYLTRYGSIVPRLGRPRCHILTIAPRSALLGGAKGGGLGARDVVAMCPASKSARKDARGEGGERLSSLV